MKRFNIKPKIPICPIHKIPMEWSDSGGWGCNQCSPCPCVRAMPVRKQRT